MRAIQRFLSHPRHVEHHRIFVAANPTEAWKRVRHFNMAEVPWVRFLFQTRTIAAKLSGEKIDFKNEGIGLDQIENENKGFKILYENEGSEVVVGSIGQFWHLKMIFGEFDASNFSEFKEPGWGKIAWAIRVEPFEQGSTISFELRMSATDEDSWRNFRRYYGLIGIASKTIRKSLMGQLENELGKLKLQDPNTLTLPGDNILPNASHCSTHSRIIEAPVSIVWKYLMQLGCDRAGWYSIDWIDNGGMPSVNHQVKEWMDRKPGERISATPNQDQFFEVYRVLHERYLVIGGEKEHFGILNDYKMSWTFSLEPVGEDATALTVRAKLQGFPTWAEWLQGNLVSLPAHTLMQSAQLRHIQRLAERDANLRAYDYKFIKSIIGDLQYHESI
jgi:hypothetical protein